MSYIRLTGQKKTLPLSGGKSVTLHRIQALRDFHLTSASVKKGDLGGWVEDISNVQDGSWVADEAMIYSSTVGGCSFVGGTTSVVDSIIRDSSIVLGDSIVHGSELVSTSVSDAFTTRSNLRHTRVNPGADIWDSSVYTSLIKDRVYVATSTIVNTRLAFHVVDANIETSQHAFMVDPMGSEESRVVLYRTKSENEHSSHTLRVGCWTGTVDELMDEVASRRAVYWSHDSELTEANNDIMFKQYEALKVLLDTIIEGW